MKELPYFKFYCNAWITGDITSLSYETQGLFVNLCAFYWSKNGELYLTNCKRKFKDCKELCFTELIECNIIKVKDDKIIINFLDEQIEERFQMSKNNALNGSKGGIAKATAKQFSSEIVATAKLPLSETVAKPSNIEEKRIEENREEENRKEKKRIKDNIKSTISIEEREQIFYKNLTHYISEYDKDMVRAFFNYWSQKNSSATKMKFEDEKFFEISKRLTTWKNNDKPKNVQFAKPIRESPLDFAKSSLLDYAKNNPEMIY